MSDFISVIALLLAAIPATLVSINLFLFRRPKRLLPGQRLSVLIPARNEERSIGATLEAVMASKDAELEIIVLDDRSEDRTRQIVEALAENDSRLRVMTAPALPPGWCGKQHACNILAGLARYPVLCFLDADVQLQPDALCSAASFLKDSRAALVSGFPFQRTGTLFEQLLVPLINFVLLGYLPIWRMRQTLSPGYAAGCGQLMLIDAAAYRKIGGHSVVQQTLHDGITLPRAFRRAGFSTDLFDASRLASCRMYQSNREAWQGLLKNATEGLGSRTLILPASVLLLGGQVLPIVLLLRVLVEPADRLTVSAACCATALVYWPRLLFLNRFGQSLLSFVLHPLGVFLLVAIQWWALLRQLIGMPAVWKGRNYPAARPQAL
jgi:uncharacterized membrane protein